MMPRYHIVNLITKETAEIDADLASDACERLGWPIRSCRVDLQPAVDPPGKRNKVSFVSDNASSDQHRLLVLMALLGALVGGLSGLGSGIAIIGAIFGGFIGGGLSVLMWAFLRSDAIFVVNTILAIALAATAIGWVIQMIYKFMHL